MRFLNYIGSFAQGFLFLESPSSDSLLVLYLPLHLLLLTVLESKICTGILTWLNNPRKWKQKMGTVWQPVHLSSTYCEIRTAQRSNKNHPFHLGPVCLQYMYIINIIIDNQLHLSVVIWIINGCKKYENWSYQTSWQCQINTVQNIILVADFFFGVSVLTKMSSLWLRANAWNVSNPILFVRKHFSSS